MNIYQEIIIELYKNPKNFGEITNATHRASIGNPTCGDEITLYLEIKDNLVVDASFVGKGCAISQASSSLFTGFLKGKNVLELKKINKDDVISLIKIDLSKNPSRMKCALLPLYALNDIKI